MINPILKKLGFSDNDRVIVFHADDIGMCHALVAAYTDLWGNSPLSSAATMVPCAWFPETARLVREQASADMGVHLTLTSEWDGMRWGAISTGDSATGLLDAEGYFYRDSASVQKHAKVEAVKVELREQIERAKAAGIDITHIDSHMGSILHPRFLSSYVELGFEFGVPAMIVRYTVEQFGWWGIEKEDAEQLVQYTQQIEQRGMPIFDEIHGMPLDGHFEDDKRLAYAKDVLDTIPAGLHYFIIHPSIDSAELRAIAPDWRARVGDYRLFLNDGWRKVVEASGVKVIGMKTLQNMMHANEQGDNISK